MRDLLLRLIRQLGGWKECRCRHCRKGRRGPESKRRARRKIKQESKAIRDGWRKEEE